MAIKLKPREKKMLYALAGVAVFGAFMLFKPDGQDIQETTSQAVDQMEQITEERDAQIQALTGGGGSGGSGDGRKGGGGGSSKEVSVLSSHNRETDCWVVFQDVMYDITAMLADYPGGPERIIKYCGTTKFEENFNFEQVLSPNEFLEKAVEKGPYTG